MQYASYDDSEFYEDELWQNISAVQNRRIYRVPSKIDEWDTPVPASICGVIWMTSKLYPELYSEEDMQKDVLAYYKQFYGLELTPEQLGL